MKLLQRKRKPDVTALADRQDVEGLAAATRFRDPLRDFEGRVIDRGEEIRAQAVLALGALGDEAGNGSVTEALRDPSDNVRGAAVRVLFRRGEVGPLAEALNWLPSDSGNSRALALRSLLELKKPGTARAVVRSLVWAPGDQPLAELDAALVQTLVSADTHADVANEVIEDLLTALCDDRVEVADRSEEVLYRLAPASVQGIIAELEGGREPERAAALLGRIGDTRALQPLIEALERREVSVRVQAASALGDLREPAAVEPLLRATRDHYLDVRAEAGQALDAIGTAAVVVGMSAIVQPMIAEAVTSAIQGQRLALEGEGAGQAELRVAARAEPPAGLLGVGGFQSALEQARAADDPSV